MAGYPATSSLTIATHLIHCLIFMVSLSPFPLPVNHFPFSLLSRFRFPFPFLVCGLRAAPREIPMKNFARRK